MSVHLAAQLDSTLIDHARKIGNLVRKGEIAPLVGAGLSQPCGIPTWSLLMDRLVGYWQEYDQSEAATTLSKSEYLHLVRNVFNDDSLMIMSYLRRNLPLDPKRKKKKIPSFWELVQQATYATAPPEPQPRQTHRHLINLFCDQPSRIWTTNYDDLIEEAGRQAGITVHSVHPDYRSEHTGLSIAHLHGLVPPKLRQSNYSNAIRSQIILAEDDYHLSASDLNGWTNREWVNLLDRYRVLIMGMSLTDPNLRRVLTLATTRARQAGEKPRQHFAVIKRPDPPTGAGSANKQKWYREFWQDNGVELVELPHHDHLVPFLARLRYESAGNEPGDLWAQAALCCGKYRPKHPPNLAYMHRKLNEWLNDIQTDFAVPKGEISEIGLFLVDASHKTLSLAFRSGDASDSPPVARQFSIDPDKPTGAAGRVYVSSDLIRIDRSHDLYDFDLPPAQRSHSKLYEGLISFPLIDWEQGGIPLGVIYVTTSTTSGRLFKGSNTPDAVDLNDLYTWLQKVAIAALNVCQGNE